MKNTLNKIIEYTVEIADPEKVILFGSLSNGNYNVYSDIDLLIICTEIWHKEYIIEKLSNFMRELSLKVDILVYMPQQIEELTARKNSFIAAILKYGKVMYKKY